MNTGKLSEAVQVPITKKMRVALELYALKEHRTMAAVVRIAIEKHLTSEEHADDYSEN